MGIDNVSMFSSKADIVNKTVLFEYRHLRVCHFMTGSLVDSMGQAGVFLWQPSPHEP